MPPAINLRHIGVPRVTVAERLAHLRGLLRRGRFSFDEAVRGADRMTVAVTLFALLELYKRGEADWEQAESFGEIAVHASACSRSGHTPRQSRGERVAGAHGRGAAVPRLRSAERAGAGRSHGGGRGRSSRRRWRTLAEQYAEGGAGSCCASWAAAGRSRATPHAEDAARRLFSRRAWRRSPPRRLETLAIVAYLQPISRPEITRIRGVSADSATATLLDRGLIEEAGRSQFGAVLYRTSDAVPEAVRAAHARRAARCRPLGPDPGGAGELRERLLRAGEARAGSGAPAE